MQTQQHPAPGTRQLPTVQQVDRAMITAAPDLEQLVSHQVIADNWVASYERATGRTDGLMRFEAEKVLFLKKVADDRALQNCDKFTVYAAWMELAVSGLSLRDGQSYIFAYGKKAAWQKGWKGALELINQRQTVVHVREPQVVYEGDVFDYEKGRKTTILRHIENRNRAKTAKITHVYWVIVFSHGEETFMMDRAEVLGIRDTYSKSYKQYLKDLPQVKDGKIQRNGQNGSTYMADFEPPMWVTSEAQAFRKTLVNRVYNNTPKSAREKYLDLRTAAVMQEIGTTIDAEEELELARLQESFAVVDNLQVNTGTGEVMEQQPPAQHPPEITLAAPTPSLPAGGIASGPPQQRFDSGQTWQQEQSQFAGQPGAQQVPPQTYNGGQTKEQAISGFAGQAGTGELKPDVNTGWGAPPQDFTQQPGYPGQLFAGSEDDGKTF